MTSASPVNRSRSGGIPNGLVQGKVREFGKGTTHLNRMLFRDHLSCAVGE
jgi:hypothetical protein